MRWRRWRRRGAAAKARADVRETIHAAARKNAAIACWFVRASTLLESIFFNPCSSVILLRDRGLKASRTRCSDQRYTSRPEHEENAAAATTPAAAAPRGAVREHQPARACPADRAPAGGNRAHQHAAAPAGADGDLPRGHCRRLGVRGGRRRRQVLPGTAERKAHCRRVPVRARPLRPGRERPLHELRSGHHARGAISHSDRRAARTDEARRQAPAGLSRKGDPRAPRGPAPRRAARPARRPRPRRHVLRDDVPASRRRQRAVAHDTVRYGRLSRAFAGSGEPCFGRAGTARHRGLRESPSRADRRARPGSGRS